MSPDTDTQVRSAVELGQTLRAARRRQGLTQDELAATARIGRQHLVGIEKGKTTERLEQLLTLMELLGLELVVRLRDPHRGVT